MVVAGSKTKCLSSVNHITKKIIQPSVAQLIGIAFQPSMRILFAVVLETN